MSVIPEEEIISDNATSHMSFTDLITMKEYINSKYYTGYPYFKSAEKLLAIEIKRRLKYINNEGKKINDD